jgi:hypothetical protein
LAALEPSAATIRADLAAGGGQCQHGDGAQQQLVAGKDKFCYKIPAGRIDQRDGLGIASFDAFLSKARSGRNFLFESAITH